MSKVSILVPIYNVEKYLRECLDSLLSQTLSDIEIICINDGSTDSSSQILEEYSSKDTRIKVINKANSGYGHSMNMGLAAATSEYIGIVESDDFVENKMFEDLYNLAIQNDAEIVKSDFLYYTTANKQARKAGKISKFYANKLISAREYSELLKMQPSIWTAIYKREFLNKNNITFLETPGASYQDTSFAFKTMALAKRVFLTEKAYLYYRQDNENSSVHSQDKVFMVCVEYDEISKFLEEHQDIKEFANVSNMIKQYGTYMWNLMRIDEKFRDMFIDKFSDTFKKYYDAGEIKEEFFKRHRKKDLDMLIKNKAQFRVKVDKRIEQEKKKRERRKNFSVRINSSRISIVLFGKQIVKIG